MTRDDSKYAADPVEVAERLVRLVALHDNVKDIENITLNSTWKELGFNELDVVELMIGVEFEFDVSFGKSKARTLRDERVGSSMVEDCASSLLPMVMSLGGWGVVPLGDGRPGMSKPDDVSCRNEKKNINKFSE